MAGKPMVFEIIGDASKAIRAFEQFEDKAGLVAAGAAAAFAAAQIGEALAANLDTEVVEARLNAQMMGMGEEAAGRAGEAAGAVFRGNFGENMGEAADAVDAVMSSIPGLADASVASIEGITAAAFNLEEGFGVGVAESAATAGAMISNGLAADGTEAMDLLTVAMGQVPTAMRGEILPAMDEYSGSFAALGIDGPQALSMITAAAQDGAIGMDKIGDSVKEFGIRVGNVDDTAAQDAMTGLGLNAEQMATMVASGGESAEAAMGQIVTALQGVDDPSQQAAAAIALFGTPLEDLGITEIPQFLSQMGEVNPALADAAGAADEFGEVLNDTNANEVAGWRRGMEGWLQDMVDVPGPVGLGVAAVSEFGGELLGMLGVLGPLGIALKGTKVAQLAGAAASGVATAAQWLWNAALSANPIGIVILAIAALVAGIIWAWTNVDGFKEGILTAWSWIKTATSGLVTAVSGWLGDMGTKISSTWNGVVSFVTGLPGRITRAASGIWNGITNTVGSITSSVTGKLDGIVSTVRGLPGRITSAAGGMFNGLWNAFRSAVNKLIGGWNRLSFTIGGGEILGVSVPSLTLSTPNIPMLAMGGTAVAPGLAIVGERGPEMVHLPLGASVIPLDRAGTGGGGETIVSLDGVELVIIDADGALVGRMRAESREVVGQVLGGQVQRTRQRPRIGV